ncbi:hypothetical protein V5799_014306 [Amblyomma americanum]|uniref:PiggyBac transposable element-derived protein domain-containing protein n=1 Tax=Amblyomma americanum TaxID=6943 RepID=A0AAQ4E3F3_AMBAM
MASRRKKALTCEEILELVFQSDDESDCDDDPEATSDHDSGDDESDGSAYSPEEGLAVDESLMKFRGRLAYVQFNPSKRARFGVKFYKLCESASGYCLNFSVYTGKCEQTTATIGMLCSEAVVINLVGDRLTDGHTIYVDNWYSSPLLFLHINQAGSNAVGTVRVHRKNMPKELKKMKLKKGECKAFFSHGIMALTWQDKKPVNMLSTCHNTASVTDTGKKNRQSGLPVLKPQVVQDYNRGMGAVTSFVFFPQMFNAFRRMVAISSSTNDTSFKCMTATLTRYNPLEKKATYVWHLKARGDKPARNVTFDIEGSDIPDQVTYFVDNDQTQRFTAYYHYTDYRNCMVITVPYNNHNRKTMGLSTAR